MNLLTDTGLAHVWSKVTDYVDTATRTFHASIDNATFQYEKGSNDFTYADIAAVKDCQIEISIANETVTLKRQEFKNIDPPDPIAGRYFGFSELIRIAGEMGELFLFVYDPDNLPTDPASLERLETWGDFQYCQSSYQPVCMGNFLVKDIAAARVTDNNAPSAKASGDYTDAKCAVVIDYMQTTFANNLMNFMADTYGPHVVFNGSVNASNTNPSKATKQSFKEDIVDAGYKRLKFYISTNTSDFGARNTPGMIVEVPLNGRFNTNEGMYLAGAASSNPQDRNVQFHVLVGVASDLSGFYYISAHSIYGTALGGRNDNGRVCYKIEAYKT